jgi:uncharacterized DUF497 family protein
VEAQAIWDDPYMIEWPAHSSEESRRAITGAFEGKLWTAIVTQREHTIRIISVRRARKNEAQNYFGGRI